MFIAMLASIAGPDLEQGHVRGCLIRLHFYFLPSAICFYAVRACVLRNFQIQISFNTLWGPVSIRIFLPLHCVSRYYAGMKFRLFSKSLILGAKIFFTGIEGNMYSMTFKYENIL